MPISWSAAGFAPSSQPFSSLALPSIGLALAVTTALTAPAQGVSQEIRSVEWTEASRMELPSTLGLLVRALPGLSTENHSRHAIHQQGSVLATTDDGSTTIIDMGERRITVIDHDDRTYLTITFEESVAAAREMATVTAEVRAEAEQALREATEELEQAREEMRQAMEEAQTRYRVAIASESTGRMETIDGMRAQQYFLTAEIEALAGVEGVEDTDEGSLSFLMELWQTDEFPDFEEIYEAWAREFAGDPALQEMAAAMAEEMEPLVGEGGWEALALWNPGVGAGLAQLGEALQEMEGTTLRSVTHVAFVPTGVTLDREALLAWEPASMGDQVRGAATSVAQDAARSAVQGAVGGITRGLFGGGGNRDPEPEPEPAAVRPLLRLTREKSDIRIGSATDAAAAFAVPAGYTERALPSFEAPR